MDPLTAIGAVASIIQLAQTALSLSKTLYSLGEAIASASDDIQALADDLKTFSQSLTLLSRLLEDSKSWYSDDIYLLTAKIIKDCAELYVKIDKILTKLGSNGSSTWKLRVKYLYKEGKIKKLLQRLRDMKGTLATILMSLQVDLQLSLLNISSSSKIQREPEKALQPETIRTLEAAKQAFDAGGLLPKYSVQEANATALQPTSEPHDFASKETAAANLLSISQSLVAMPSPSHQLPAPAAVRSRLVKQAAAKAAKPVASSQVGLFMSDTIEAPAVSTYAAARNFQTQSLKSASSNESFHSAISMQDEDIDVARRIKAVQSVMHAFRTALQTLEGLMEKRIQHQGCDLYLAARDLQSLLQSSSREIDNTHIMNFKSCGHPYLRSFIDTHAFHLQEQSSNFMTNVVMKLHIYSAEHEDLDPSNFRQLGLISQQYCREIVLYLRKLAPPANDHPGAFVSYSPASISSSPISLPQVPLIGALNEEDSYTIKCICGYADDDGNTTYCKACDTWQHIDCFYPGQVEGALGEDFEHFCANCKPRHLDTFGAAERQGKQRKEIYARLNNGEKTRRPPSKSHKKKKRQEFADPSPEAWTQLPFIGYAFKRFDGFATASEGSKDTEVCKAKLDIHFGSDPAPPSQCPAGEMDEMEDGEMEMEFEIEQENPYDDLDLAFSSGTEVEREQGTRKLAALEEPFEGMQAGQSMSKRKRTPDESDMRTARSNSRGRGRPRGNRDGRIGVSPQRQGRSVNTEPPSLQHNTESAPTKPTSILPLKMTNTHEDNSMNSESNTLWWEAFRRISSATRQEEDSFLTLNHELDGLLLGTSRISDKVLWTIISHELRNNATDFGNNMEVRGMFDNIIRIMTIFNEQQLGLEVGALGWSCIWIFLKIFSVLSPGQNSPIILKSYHNMLEIVAIIARYAVMENLYSQTGGALSLKPEYREALVSLCCSILQFFAAVFKLGRSLRGETESTETMAVRLDELMNEIKKRNEACKGFRVVVETKEESEEDSGSDSNVEDVTDGNWEEGNGVEAERSDGATAE